jgi:hypothetical protein
MVKMSLGKRVSRALTHTLAVVSLGFSLSANAGFITDVSAGVETIFNQGVPVAKPSTSVGDQQPSW